MTTFALLPPKQTLHQYVRFVVVVVVFFMLEQLSRFYEPFLGRISVGNCQVVLREVTCPGSRGEEDLPLVGFPHLHPSVLVDAVVAFSGCGGRLSLGCVLSAHAGSPVFTQCTVS